eukprot:5146908-Pyramimonas_sp.AAC.1
MSIAPAGTKFSCKKPVPQNPELLAVEDARGDRRHAATGQLSKVIDGKDSRVQIVPRERFCPPSWTKPSRQLLRGVSKLPISIPPKKSIPIVCRVLSDVHNCIARPGGM